MKGRETKLTDEQRAWMLDNFRHTPNAQCAERLGVSLRTVSRIARKLGLYKSEEFMACAQINAARHAAAANRGAGNTGKANLIHGTPWRFRPGHDPRGTMTEEQWCEMHARKGKSLSATWARERRRVLFGLEQRTRLKAGSEGNDVTNMRYILRRRGYVIERGSRLALITGQTSRSERVERRAKRLHFRFTEQL